MVPPFDHLWGQVVERTAERLPPRVWRVDAPAKVGDFQLTLDADEEVLGLDVAVNHVLLVAVRQRPGERRDVGGGALLAEPLSLLELLVQLTAGGVLEDQVHAVLFDWWERGRGARQRRSRGGQVFCCVEIMAPPSDSRVGATGHQRLAGRIPGMVRNGTTLT